MSHCDNVHRVALWGFGNMNKIIIGYLVDKGYKVVAVIGHHDIGKDAGEVAGLSRLDVAITHRDNADAVLDATEPTVAIVATRSFLKDIADTLQTLAQHKINAIAIAEEAFYSVNTEPALTQELDALFKSNGVSWTGTGYQDAYWLYLASVLVGVSHKVDRLVCHTSFNVDDYGAALCEAHGVGLTPAEFTAKFITQQDNIVPAYVWNSNEALAIRLGWKVVSTTQVYEALLAPKEIRSKSAGLLLTSGKVNGLKAIVTTIAETKDGRTVEIETHQIGQVYYDDLEDYCHWQTHGTPSLELNCKKPDTVGVTCATAVNRIPHVVAARPGYVTVAELGPLA